MVVEQRRGRTLHACRQFGEGCRTLPLGDACASGDAALHEAALRMVIVEGGVFGALADAVLAALDILGPA